MSRASSSPATRRATCSWRSWRRPRASRRRSRSTPSCKRKPNGLRGGTERGDMSPGSKRALTWRDVGRTTRGGFGAVNQRRRRAGAAGRAERWRSPSSRRCWCSPACTSRAGPGPAGVRNPDQLRPGPHCHHPGALAGAPRARGDARPHPLAGGPGLAGLGALRRPAERGGEAAERGTDAPEKVRRHAGQAREACRARGARATGGGTLEAAAEEAAGGTAGARRSVPRVQPGGGPARRAGLAGGQLVRARRVRAQAMVVFFLALYLLASGDLFKRKLVRIAGPTLSEKKITVQILDEIDRQVAAFLLIRIVDHDHPVGSPPGWPPRRSAWSRRRSGASPPASSTSSRTSGPVVVAVVVSVVAFVQFGTLSMALAASGITVVLTTARGLLAHAVADEPRRADERGGGLRGPALLGLAVGASRASCSPCRSSWSSRRSATGSRGSSGRRRCWGSRNAECRVQSAKCKSGPESA